MKEWAIINVYTGRVVNIVMKYDNKAPDLSKYFFTNPDRYKAVPVSQVALSNLQDYEYWSKRP